NERPAGEGARGLADAGPEEAGAGAPGGFSRP
ncbi:MAG: hypothetical protein AVDCRST_MAG31-2170, partial [uncultured Sphingomonas sp.]